MSHSANDYYDNLTRGISDLDLQAWELQINDAEHCRLDNRSVMDIFGASQPGRDTESMEAAGHPTGSVSDWLQLAIDIEEKQ